MMPVSAHSASRLKQLLFVGILATAGGFVSLLTVYKLSVANAYRLFSLPDMPNIAIPTDAASRAWGLHLVRDVLACRSCHGADLGGRILKDDAVAIVSAPNLTAPRGAADWLRALRLGVDAEGRGLWLMPTRAHSALCDRDLGAIAAAVGAQPAVTRRLPQSHLRLRGLWAVASRQWRPLTTDAARTQAPNEAIDEAANADFGAYLAQAMQCARCHVPKAPHSGAGAPPAAPPLASPLTAPSLADAAAFRAALLAKHPGSNGPHEEAQPAFATPLGGFARLTDVEFAALWRYFQGA